MEKKAAIEIQFNWMFVLIVGVIIFIFFTRITMKYQEVSESKIAISVLANVDTIATGAASSRDTDQIIDIPNVNMKISSTEDCYRTYKIGGNNRRLEDVFIFSPDEIEGNKLIFWTLDWSIPYRIANLVFLTSPLVKYVIVGDSGLANEVNSMLDSGLGVPLAIEQRATPGDISLVPDHNHYQVRFVFFGFDPDGVSVSQFEDMPDKDVTAIQIIPDGTTFEETGTIRFFEKEADVLRPVTDGTTYYLKKEAMYGALFSGNKYIYNCNMKAAFERLRFVSQLYQNRSILLNNIYSAQSLACANYYSQACCNDANPRILTIRDLAEDMAREFPRDLQDMNDMYTVAYNEDSDFSLEGIKQLNNHVLYYSCPEIY